jgi:predicted RNA-binding Zn-ribbon protein involved in translation (DUF1610 family)
VIRLLQRGSREAAAGGLTAVGEAWPPAAMAHRVIRSCDECSSPFFVSASHMAGLCPECAHHLYGKPPCDHQMVAGRCQTCGWNGSVSPFVASVKRDAGK